MASLSGGGGCGCEEAGEGLHGSTATSAGREVRHARERPTKHVCVWSRTKVEGLAHVGEVKVELIHRLVFDCLCLLLLAHRNDVRAREGLLHAGKLGQRKVLVLDVAEHNLHHLLIVGARLRAALAHRRRRDGVAREIVDKLIIVDGTVSVGVARGE